MAYAEYTDLPELLQIRVPRGMRKALDKLARRTFEDRSTIVRQILLRELDAAGISISA